jgi:hypothetical protein
MTQIQSDVIGNIIVIFAGKKGKGSERFAILDNIALSAAQKDSIYQAEVAALKTHNSQEAVDLLLSHKEEFGILYWREFSDSFKKNGVESFRKAFASAANTVIATMGSGNYIFDLIGHYPYPHTVSDFEFRRYREHLGTLRKSAP